MSPQRQLTALIALTVAVIVAAWIVLFRRHVFTPPVRSAAAGPSLDEISRQFEEQFGAFNAQRDAFRATEEPRNGGTEEPRN